MIKNFYNLEIIFQKVMPNIIYVVSNNIFMFLKLPIFYYKGNTTIFGGLWYTEINDYYTELGALA